MKKLCHECDGTGIIFVRPESREEVDLRVLGTDLCACGKCSNCEYRRHKDLRGRGLKV